MAVLSSMPLAAIALCAFKDATFVLTTNPITVTMVVAVTCRLIGGHLPFGCVMRQSIAHQTYNRSKAAKFSHQLKNRHQCHPMGKHLPLYRLMN